MAEEKKKNKGGKKEKSKSKKKRSFPIYCLRLLGKIILWFLILSVATVLLYRFVNPPITPLMAQRVLEQSFDSKRDVRLQKSWRSIEKISPQLPQAVVASEDNLFLTHNGFDFTEISKAMDERKSGKRIRGGSTISMQTAKNVFLLPYRNFVRKGLEVYFTCLIELFWSKERIMEVYLNVIEYGDGIYGAESASQFYFNKSASRLSSREAALLAACLPSPLKRNPAKPTAYISSRASKIQSLMGLIGAVDFDKAPPKEPKKKKKKTAALPCGGFNCFACGLCRAKTNNNELVLTHQRI